MKLKDEYKYYLTFCYYYADKPGRTTSVFLRKAKESLIQKISGKEFDAYYEVPEKFAIFCLRNKCPEKSVYAHVGEDWYCILY